MTQYIVLVQDNARTKPSAEEWNQFIAAAKQTGLFEGGSAIGNRVMLGNTQSAKPTGHINGYMRFDSDDRQALLDLLAKHPVVVQGGSVELCELPKT